MNLIQQYTYNKVNKNIHSIHSLYTYTHIINKQLHNYTTSYIYLHKKKKHTIMYLSYIYLQHVFHDTILLPLIKSPSTIKIQIGKTGKMTFLNNYIDSYQINYISSLRNH